MEENIETKYSSIETELRDLVFSDAYQPGDKLPSENALAKQYGVSRQTVRKALEGLEREGYIYAVHGSGRYVSERTLHRKQSKNIAVVMTYLSDYIFPKVISGIDQVLSANGYDLILKHTNTSRHGEIACLEELMGKDIDGIIIEPSKSNMYCKHTDLFGQLERYEIPYVFIQGEYEAMAEKPHVLLDDEKGSFLLTKYLIENGHREIYGIFKSDDSQGQKRHNGYARALAGAGIPYDPSHVIWFYTEDRKVHPVTSLQNIIRNGKNVDAVVCYNDQIARHVIRAIREVGKHVPEDISVTGYDNSDSASMDGKQLTTVVHPQEELGRLAADMLLHLIRGEETERRIVIEPVLVEGDTVRKKDAGKKKADAEPEQKQSKKTGHKVRKK